MPGEDRLSWLDSLTSQGLTRLAPGESTELLVLDPHGHVEHAASVLDDGETTWLIVDRADAEGLLSWLRKMRFRLRVDPRDADQEYAVIGGARAAIAAVDAAAPAGLPLVWTDPWPRVSVGGHGYATVDPHPAAGRDWAEAIVTRAEEQRIADAAAQGEIALAGLVAVEALRVARMAPAVVDGGRRPGAPARAGLAPNRGAPGEGLLSRPGDRRQGAQSRSSAPPHRGAPTRWE